MLFAENHWSTTYYHACTDISNSIEKNYSDAWVSHDNFNIKIKYN